MATRHRRDMQHIDFYVLARFVHAIRKVCISSCCPALELGTITMLLPTWYLSGAGWQLAGYREYTEPAFGIPRNHMQTMCDYLDIEMTVVLDVLYRFSMLAVVPGTLATDQKPRFRTGYFGYVREYYGTIQAEQYKRYVKGGFIVERRRATGLFHRAAE